MVNILFSRIDLIDDIDLIFYKSLLPNHMKEEVDKYRFVSDQKLTLLGKLMLKYAIDLNGSGDLSMFRRAANNKPYVSGWKGFNISHSKDTVVFCSSHMDVGIDIETSEIAFTHELMDFYTPNEKEVIINSVRNDKKALEIWVKKEAFAKASGAALGTVLNNIDCTPNSILYNDRLWGFVEFQLGIDFISYFCTNDSCLDYDIQLFNPKYLL